MTSDRTSGGRSAEVNSIVLCEPHAAALEHALFNAALIETCCAGYPAARVHFFGRPKHLEAVLAEMDGRHAARMHWHRTWAECLPGTALGRGSSAVACLGQVLCQAGRAHASLIVCCSCTRVSALALKALLAVRPRQRALVVLHSNFAERRPAGGAVPGRVARQLFSFDRVLSWRHGTPAPSHLRYVVLSEPIREEVARRLPRLAPLVHALPHPYLFLPHGPKQLDPCRPVRFGFLGVGTLEKGFDWFVRLAREVRCELPGAEFHLVGASRERLPEAGLGGDPASVLPHVSPVLLPRGEYDDRASSMAYALILHDPEAYRLRASGAVLDAFRFCLPVIARRSRTCEHYFERMGDIGYLVSTYAELKDRVASILRDPPLARYAAQSRKIAERRGQFQPASVAPALRSIVDAV
jgi:glycosyltransferase involved in cell wall biosynthesis